ncbi:radical SAM family heme chaperone HemW [Pseudotabrizicola sp. 4114]|uniref:radical SAM family heme chaperone HemW n=1 Tax=Pseudotabrizicola sp. 4114 TaxID=2817731 RepID=UPI00286206AC|nr:oxygen-independent coproporphyrinogen-3 oxidase [Pseudorhodobacter sp. 4114]
MQRWQSAGFGLYIHWPFCQSKCPYCDFNSHVTAQIDQDVWREAYLSELRRYAEETPNRVLSSIFFGGGTPSLMPPATVAAIIDEATRLWTPANDIEITLEANPTSVEIGRFRDFRMAGVNRVSVGIQALNDIDLRRLGRLHDSSEARAAISVSQTVFDRTSFDLIYARQDQSLSAWEAELREALSLAGDHLSLYQLTIEPGTAFGARFDRGLLPGLPDEDLAVDMYEITQALCDASNMSAYEISNHAKPGEESRHNMIYWRCGDYVGIGPGAHGRLTDESGRRISTNSPAMPTEWLKAVQSCTHLKPEALSADDQATELLIMGLRVNAGADLMEYERIAGEPLPALRISNLSNQGLVDVSGGRIKTTPAGRLVLNWILKQLLVG